RDATVTGVQTCALPISGACGADYRVDYKEGAITNMVTDVDRRSERAIVEILHAAFPGHRILAEEGGEHSQRKSPYRWIVDPLDRSEERRVGKGWSSRGR